MLGPRVWGTIDPHTWRVEQWARFYTAAPPRQRQSVARSTLVKASVRSLAAYHGINAKTVQKWRHRASAADARFRVPVRRGRFHDVTKPDVTSK
jgi:hypothetical protein